MVHGSAGNGRSDEPLLGSRFNSAEMPHAYNVSIGCRYVPWVALSSFKVMLSCCSDKALASTGVSYL